MRERAGTSPWRILLWVAIVGVALAFLWLVRGVLPPFILAWLIAVLLNPLVKGMGKLKIPRPIAVFVIAGAFFGLVGLVAVWAVPQLSRQVNEVRTTVQSFTERLAADTAEDNVFVRWNPAVAAKPPGTLGFVDGFLEENRATLDQFGLPSTRRAFNEQYIQPHRDDISNGIRNGFNGLVAFLGGAASQLVLLAFTPLFAIFLMLDLEGFGRRFGNWIPPSIRLQTLEFIDDIGGVLQGYIRGVTINISVYMVVMATVLTLLGVPFSYIFAIVGGLLYLIPNIGGLITGTTLFFATGLSGSTGNLNVGNSWAFAFVVFVCFTVITTTWDVVITPRVVGKAVNLHPFVGMFVVFSGGALFGVLGMMLAYPVAGVVKIILERLLAITHKRARTRLDLPAVPLRHRTEGSV